MNVLKLVTYILDDLVSWQSQGPQGLIRNYECFWRQNLHRVFDNKKQNLLRLNPDRPQGQRRWKGIERDKNRPADHNDSCCAAAQWQLETITIRVLLTKSLALWINVKSKICASARIVLWRNLCFRSYMWWSYVWWFW